MGRFAAAARDLRGYRLEQFSPQSTAYWVAKLFGGGSQTASGITVNADNAMAIPTVYAACRNLAEDTASLPLPVYRGVRGAGRGAIDPAATGWALLNLKANPEMGAMTFRETILGHVFLRGDGFAEKELDQALRVKALWPLNPARMRMARNGQNGFVVAGAPANRLFFRYSLPNGQEKIFDQDLIFHPRGFGPDGIHGYSIVALAREAMGVALATEAYAGRFFANDAAPGIVLTHPKTLSPKAKENIEHSWKDSHEGLDNAHRIAILEEGLTVERVGMLNVDAQFLETRKWERGELATMFRMPPDKIGDYEFMHLANIEQSDINYAKYTIKPHAVRFEQQVSIDGLVDAGHYAEHNLADFFRGDAKTRGEYLHNLRQDGAISANGIADLENLPHSDDPAADQLLIPLNMTPASAFGDDGLTMVQRAHAAWELMRAGYEADGVNKLLGLGDLAHTGFVPGTQNPDPAAANT